MIDDLIDGLMSGKLLQRECNEYELIDDGDDIQAIEIQKVTEWLIEVLGEIGKEAFTKAAVRLGLPIARSTLSAEEFCAQFQDANIGASTC